MKSEAEKWQEPLQPTWDGFTTQVRRRSSSNQAQRPVMVVIKDGKSCSMSSCSHVAALLRSCPTLFPPHFHSPASVPWDTLPSSRPVHPPPPVLSRTFPSPGPLSYPLPVGPEAASPGALMLLGWPCTHWLAWWWFWKILLPSRSSISLEMWGSTLDLSLGLSQEASQNLLPLLRF